MYLEQWERINRWLGRVEGKPDEQADYVDFLWALFQNCWNFKEWVKNDPATPALAKNQIEKDIDSYESLRICADLANGSKHLVRTRTNLGARQK